MTVALARRLTRQTISVLKAEPAHGLFARVARGIGQTRFANIAVQMGIDGRYVRPAQCLDVMLRHDLDRPDHLISNTPVVEEDRVTLRGHVFSRSRWSLVHRRYCPACLGESPHHRSWWDLTFVATCPFHGLTLGGDGKDGTRAFWSSTVLENSEDRTVATSGVSRLPERPRILESYVLGRMDYAPRLDAPLLDAHGLEDTVEAVQRVGLALAGGARTEVPEIDRDFDGSVVNRVGFEALGSNHDHLVEVLAAMATTSPLLPVDERKEAGATQLFGWLFDACQMSSNPILQRVRTAMIGVAVATGRVRRSRSLVSGTETFGRLTLKQVAVELGMTRRPTAELAAWVLPDFDRSSLGLRVLLSHDDLALLREARDTALDRPGLAKHLGLETKDLKVLEAEGLIRTCMGIAGRRRVGHRFLKAEADQLVDGIAIVPTSGPEVPFRVHAKATGISTGRLAVKVARGEISPSGRSVSGQGFVSLMFPATGIPVTAAVVSTDRRRVRLVDGGLSNAEVAARLDFSLPTVAYLLAAGFLEPHQARVNQTGKPRICERSVDAFDREHVAAKTLAMRLGCHPSEASARLAGMGIRSVLGEVDYKTINAVVRRSDLPDHLQVPEPDDTNAVFWAELRKAVQAHCGTFKLPPRPKPGGTVVWNGKRTLAVKIEIEPTLRLTVECDRKTSPRRYRAAVERREELAALLQASVALENNRVEVQLQVPSRDSSEDRWRAINHVCRFLATMQDAFSRTTL